MSAVMRRLDHVVVASPDAQALVDLLAGTFGLPIVWPVFDYGGWVSGGLSLGNANLEIAQLGGGPTAALAGLVFEPEGSLTGAVAELDRLGIPHGEPYEYRGAIPDADGMLGGPPGTRYWTTCSVDRADAGFFALLCAYERELVRPQEEWERLLAATGGGSLGIVGLAGVVVGAADVDAARSEWGSLLAGPDGGALEFVMADEPGLRALVLEVRSLEAATAFLSGIGEGLQGLDVRLVEAA